MNAHITPAEETSGGHWEWTPDRYRRGTFSHATGSERQRLGLLQSLLDEHTQLRFKALGVKPGDQVLEVGGGGGSVARWLAEQGFRVTATDLDTTFLDDLTVLGVRVLRHDMYTEDFQPEFDVIHARYVLVHLPDPDKAVVRLTKWLKPGGVLFLEEAAGFPVRDSPHPAYRAVMGAFLAHLQRSLGTDPNWARTLPMPLQKAGLVDVGFDARLPLVNGGDSQAEWLRLNLEQSRSAIVAAGLADDADFEAAFRELESPDFRDLAPAVFTAWGRRAG